MTYENELYDEHKKKTSLSSIKKSAGELAVTVGILATPFLREYMLSKYFAEEEKRDLLDSVIGAFGYSEAGFIFTGGILTRALYENGQLPESIFLAYAGINIVALLSSIPMVYYLRKKKEKK